MYGWAAATSKSLRAPLIAYTLSRDFQAWSGNPASTTLAPGSAALIAACAAASSLTYDAVQGWRQ